MYTPMFYTLFRADPFGVNSLYSSLNLVAATDAQPGQRAFAARASNLVRYRTPAAQPWFADVAYAFGEAASPNSSSGNLWGATFGWNSKPFYLGYGLQRHKDGSAAAPVPAPATASHQALSAAWDATADVRLSASLMRVGMSGTATPDARIRQLGAEWRFIPSTRALASVARRSVEGSPRGQSTWSLGLDHSLSKRTMVYARWLGLENRGAAAATLAGVAVAANSGDDVRSFAIGVKHDF
jgi:predicted porin